VADVLMEHHLYREAGWQELPALPRHPVRTPSETRRFTPKTHAVDYEQTIANAAVRTRLRCMTRRLRAISPP